MLINNFKVHTRFSEISSLFFIFRYIFPFFIFRYIFPFFSNHRLHTAWKVSKYRVFSGPYFPAFGLNMERYRVSLRIQSEFWKIRTTKNSAFGHFSRSVIVCHLSKIYLQLKRKAWLYLGPDFQFFSKNICFFIQEKEVLLVIAAYCKDFNNLWLKN